jgi:hypothetical protein
MQVWTRLLVGIALVFVWLPATNRPASAIPAFAAQTGQPCTTCHFGGFDPQLTPFGRAFKIGGYTQRGGEGWQSYFPLAAMVQTSFTNAGTGVPPDQVTHHYNNNNNFSLDQISIFLGGGIGEHTGGFVQATYSDVPNASNLDNADLRPYTTTFDLLGKELRVGTTVNNNPTMQDPYNSSFAGVTRTSRQNWRLHPRHHQSLLAGSTTTQLAIPGIFGTIAIYILRLAPIRP